MKWIMAEKWNNDKTNPQIWRLSEGSNNNYRKLNSTIISPDSKEDDEVYEYTVDPRCSVCMLLIVYMVYIMLCYVITHDVMYYGHNISAHFVTIIHDVMSDYITQHNINHAQSTACIHYTPLPFQPWDILGVLQPGGIVN